MPEGSGEPLYLISWSEADDKELREVRVRVVRLDRIRATVVVEGSDKSVQLTKIDDKWRVDAAPLGL